MDINDGIITVGDVSSLAENTNIQIDTEVMRIDRIVGSTLHVKRGWNGSTIAGHVAGSGILEIDEADHATIEADDDFGFGELYSDFTDMKKRNPLSGADEAI